MKIKHVTALCVMAFQTASALADQPKSEGAILNALEKQVAALQAQIDALKQSSAVKGAAAATAVPSEQDDGKAPAVMTNDEVVELKQQVENQQLKVDSLTDAANTGPIAGLSITGYIDPTYVYNRASHSGGFLFLNHEPGAYDYFNSTIGDVYLDIKKTFGTGPLAPAAEIVVQPNRGVGNLFSNEHGGIGNNIFTQADVTVPFSMTKTLTVGMFPSFNGYELQPSNQMLTLTHNLLYDFSESSSMVGVAMKGSDAAFKHFWEVSIGNEQLRSAGAIYDAANNTTKSNWTPTLSARYDYAALSAWDLGVSGNIGRQSLYSPCAAAGGYGYQCNGSSPTGFFEYVEADATYKRDKTQFNAQVDYGELQKGAWNGGTARWYGTSLLGHTKWTSSWIGRMGTTLRFDYLNNATNGGGGSNIVYGLSSGNPSVNGTSGFGIDPDCFKTSSTNGTECKGAQRYAITADLLFYPTDQITVKLEYRHDAANHPVFLKSNGDYSRSNDVVAAQFIYSL